LTSCKVYWLASQGLCSME